MVTILKPNQSIRGSFLYNEKKIGAGVADDPETKITLKAFHNEILNDHPALKKEIN